MFAKAVIKEGSVKIYYKNSNKSIRVSTGVTGVIDEVKYFSNGKLTAKVEDFVNKNSLIATKLQQVNKIINDYIKLNDVKPPVDYVKLQLSTNGAKTEAEQEIQLKKTDNFEPYYDQFYKFKIDGDKKVRVKDSCKDYVSNKNALLAYQKKYGDLTLNTMNSGDFIEAFEKFLSGAINIQITITTDKGKERKVTVEGKLNGNTVSKRISYLKVFLNWLDVKKHISIDPEVEKYKVADLKYKTTIVILEKEEIQQLQALELTNETEIALRDYMIVLIATGMRYSDLYSLEKSMIDENEKWITKEAQKTTGMFTVPIKPSTLELIKKYDYNFTRFKNQVYNRMIKKLLVDKKICQQNIKVKTRVNNKEITTTVAKYKEIGSHTGRRTFVANCFRTGFNIVDIMGMTGHKKVDTLIIYRDTFAKEDYKVDKFFASDNLI